MFWKLLLIFIGIPLLELAILVKIGTIIGVWYTILLILVTGFMGAALAKQQGLQVMYRIQEELGKGRLPSNELLDGLCILIGGLLLLTPGILTDVISFVLLIPASRKIIKFALKKFWARKRKIYSYYPPPDDFEGHGGRFIS